MCSIVQDDDGDNCDIVSLELEYSMTAVSAFLGVSFTLKIAVVAIYISKLGTELNSKSNIFQIH